MFKTTLLAAAATLALAGSAAAQGSPSAGRLDRDGDKRVSLAEMQARQAERFARMDVDRDGQLTREERRAGRQAMRAERSGKRADRQAAVFARRDTDRDGALSQAEAPKRFAAHFTHLDADANGRLTPQELQAGVAMLRDQRGPRPARAAPTQRADVNNDGVLTQAEAAARVEARFARLDVNRDGFVTRDERRSARQQRRG